MRRRALAAISLAAVLAVGFAVTAVGRTAQSSSSVKINMTGAPPNFQFTGVPRQIKAGTVKFTFRNTSTQPSGVQHNFTVVKTFGQAKAFKSASLASGKSQTLSVNLKPGTYVAICTIGNGFHAANRMTTAFVVQ
ncbi:MAG: hypothetical protein QOD44_2208 [Solirubrobacteraceae bacterium]|jgi:hypothetical protein|nr:hypothetical protein [Solirubrobacteraceae bacterium]